MLTARAIEKEEVALGIRYRFLNRQPNLRNELFRFTNDGFAVRMRGRIYACLPSQVAVVFQPWNSGIKSVACWEETFRWPDNFGPAIWVQSNDEDEIFRLTQLDTDSAEKRHRVFRRAPWQHGPSMSVDDVIAMKIGNCIRLVRCESVGWSTIEEISDSFRI